jgi:signal transduction histidine kinase
VKAQTPWQALARPGFLLSAWPARSAAYLAANGLAGLLAMVVGVVLLSVGGSLAVILVGIPFLGAFALLGLPLAAVERGTRRMIGGYRPFDLHRLPPDRGLTSWLRTRFVEGITWREFGYALLTMVVLWPVDLLAVTLAVTVPAALIATPVLLATTGHGEQVNVLKTYEITSWPAAFATSAAGLVALAVCGYGLGLLAAIRGALAEFFISPVAARITELTRTTVALIDAFEAERRRLERDLHDGAQQRLVAVTMMLGLARLDAPPGPLAAQLTRAHDEAERALVELRELVRGIHPPVLTDFGLEAAIAELADRSVIPVDVALTLPHRFPQPIESTTYFVVSEALSNMAKHSDATHGEISGRYERGRLVVKISDDGRGGADKRAGGGLSGLGDRVSVFDGRLSLSSPPGGPTSVVVEIPCKPLPHSG